MELIYNMESIVFSFIVVFVLGLFIGYVIGRVQKERFKSVKSRKDTTKVKRNRFKMNPIFNKSASLDYKPMVLSSSSTKDNLKKIKGIDEEIEEKLYKLGIFHFDQIAKWTNKNSEWVENFLGLPNYTQDNQWISQAKILQTGSETNYSKRLLEEEDSIETFDESKEKLERN